MPTDEIAPATVPPVPMGVEVVEWQDERINPPPHSTPPEVHYTLFLFCGCGCETTRVATCSRFEGNWYSVGGGIMIQAPIEVRGWAVGLKGPHSCGLVS